MTGANPIYISDGRKEAGPYAKESIAVLNHHGPSGPVDHCNPDGLIDHELSCCHDLSRQVGIV